EQYRRQKRVPGGPGREQHEAARDQERGDDSESLAGEEPVEARLAARRIDRRRLRLSGRQNRRRPRDRPPGGRLGAPAPPGARIEAARLLLGELRLDAEELGDDLVERSR